MLISEFNQGSSNEISLRLNHCVHIPRWANEILQQRPFDLVTDLLQFAEQRARTWTWDEILNALNTHPRIGEKKRLLNSVNKNRNFRNMNKLLYPRTKKCAKQFIKAMSLMKRNSDLSF